MDPRTEDATLTATDGPERESVVAEIVLVLDRVRQHEAALYQFTEGRRGFTIGRIRIGCCRLATPSVASRLDGRAGLAGMVHGRRHAPVVTSLSCAPTAVDP